MNQPTRSTQSIPQFCKTYPLTKCLRDASLLALALLSVIVAPLRADDATWNNADGSFLWNLTNMDWRRTSAVDNGVWNNASGDGAIFGATGVGAINVPTSINVDSIGFLADGYTLN